MKWSGCQDVLYFAKRKSKEFMICHTKQGSEKTSYEKVEKTQFNHDD